MRTNYLSVLIHIRTKGEVGTVKPSCNFLPDRSQTVIHLWILFFTYLCLSMPYCLVYVIQPCGNLLEKGRFLGSPVGDIFLCFGYIPIQYPGSVVILDFIDS